MIGPVKASAFLFLCLSALMGCTPEPEPLVVWSNVSDTAFLVELYNRDAEQPISFRYTGNLTEALTQQRVDADVVIGRWVNNPPARERMLPEWDEEPWVPLAFNLGTIVFDASRARISTDRSPSIAITPHEVGEHLRRLAAAPDSEPEPMRFVPTLDPRFLYEMIRVGGVVPEPYPEGGPRWSAERYDGAFATIREWQATWNESSAAERAYREQYLYEPWYRLLENQRVFAVYIPSTEFLDWSFFGGTTLDFRWLAQENGQIQVLEDMVYAGIPASSARRNKARQFIAWIRDPDTQLALMHHKIDQRIDSFGVFGGFSMEGETNRRMARDIYPELAGRIPPADMLAIPGPRPRYWNEALEAVVHPFLGAGADRDLESEGTAPPGEGEELGRQLRRWYDQRGD